MKEGTFSMETKISGILGTRLRREREIMGITQEALAKAVGLSSEFISLLELGKRMPSLETLTTLSDFFRKDVSFFVKEKEEAFNVLLQDERVDNKARALLKKFKKYCEEYLHLEDLTGRRIELAPLYSHPSAEAMADEERRRLGVGNEPVRDIFSLFELNGLRILRLPIPEESKISGVFIFFEAERAAFALVNSAQPFEQQVFTSAHEYCHYLKHRYSGPVIDHPDIFIEEYLPLYHPREKFAQKFAVCFLIPSQKIKEVIEEDLHSKNISFADVLYLKEYFGVSIPDLLHTLKDLAYIPNSKYEAFIKIKPSIDDEAYFKDSGRHVRPLKKGSKAKPSRRFMSLAIEACQKKKISEEKFSELVSQNKEKIRSVLKSIGYK
jgi:transcriptional regulator with XRE-family HTH domain